MPEEQKSDCQEYLEEYQALKRRIEEEEFENPDLDDEVRMSDDDYADDINRLEELEEIIAEECDFQLPEDETDLDLPEYAGTSPSEPMDFDSDFEEDE